VTNITEEEEDVLSTLVDAMGQLLKLHGQNLMPFFDEHVAPKFAPFLANTQPQSLQVSQKTLVIICLLCLLYECLQSGCIVHSWHTCFPFLINILINILIQVVAICMIDDIIEFGGVNAHKYIPQTLDIFLSNISSDHPVLRQSSVYGIAQSIRFAPELCAGQLHDIVSALVCVVTSEEAKEEENEGTTENALFALGMPMVHIACSYEYSLNCACAPDILCALALDCVHNSHIQFTHSLSSHVS
jgi:hypothetical protein